LTREPKSLDTSPKLPPEEDYGACIVTILNAAKELNEALPNGQRLRGETAFGRLVPAVNQLGVWMKTHGYWPD
jgi:hypothetical protein